MEHEFQKNEEIIMCIDDNTSTGEGIGRVNGYSFFVKNAIKGEKIRAVITKLKKSYGYAALLEVMEESEDRILPKCEYYKHCGGCNLQHMSYQRQLLFKKDKINSALSKLGGLDVSTEHVIRADRVFRYRNKAQYPVGYSEDGSLVAGFYAQRSHRIVAIDDCILEPKINSKIIRSILSCCEEQHISAYNEEKHFGFLRHIMIRHAFQTDEIMVTMIVNGAPRFSKELSKRLLDQIIKTINFFNHNNGLNYRLSSFGINYNNKKTNVILGDETQTVYGKSYIIDEMNGIQYAVDAHSFYQVNHSQAEKLYQEVKRLANPQKTDIVFDMYCGAGTIGLYLADKVRQVYGVEIVPEAIEMARLNAERNHIENAEFFCGSADDMAEMLYLQKGIRADVVIVDPPRKGCSEEMLQSLLNIASDRIVYVSCDPATMARDLKRLTEGGGYQIKEVLGVDQFCQTYHVETVALLSKRDVNKHISVKIEPDERI